MKEITGSLLVLLSAVLIALMAWMFRYETRALDEGKSIGAYVHDRWTHELKIVAHYSGKETSGQTRIVVMSLGDFTRAPGVYEPGSLALRLGDIPN